MARKTPACATCPETPGEGWRVQGVTHCRDCHATWPITSAYQHCVRCHETFGGIESATRHEGPERCRNPRTIVHKVTGAPVLRQRDDGVWVREYGK